MRTKDMGRAVSMTSKGQVTVPAEVRKALGLKERDRVVFEVDAHAGIATMRRLESIEDAYGAVTPRHRPEDFARLREEFERGVAEEGEGR